MAMNMDDFIRNVDMTTGIFDEFQRRIFEDMGFGNSFNPNERMKRESRSDDHTNTKITTKKPREGYIDGGIVMSKGFFVTRRDYEEASMEDWAAFREWAESMDNIRVNEMGPEGIVEQRLLWVYDVPPSITSMKP